MKALRHTFFLICLSVFLGLRLIILEAELFSRFYSNGGSIFGTLFESEEKLFSETFIIFDFNFSSRMNENLRK